METTILLFVTGESRVGRLVRERLETHQFLNPDLEGRIQVLWGEEHPQLAEHYGVTEYPTVVAIDDKHNKLWHTSGGWNLTRRFFQRAVNHGKLSKTKKRLGKWDYPHYSKRPGYTRNPTDTSGSGGSGASGGGGSGSY